MNTVYVVGQYAEYLSMFLRRGWEEADNIFDADLMLFCGGSDVDPSYYNHNKHSTTYSNIERDKYETKKWKYAKELGIPCAGICRGGQFLHVMNGGELYQNVDGHASGPHEAMYMGKSISLTVSSTHHQMMKRNYARDDAITLLLAKESTIRSTMSPLSRSPIAYNHKNYNNSWDDLEAVVYTDTRDLCFQPHPEFSGEDNRECQDVFFSFINNYLVG